MLSVRVSNRMEDTGNFIIMDDTVTTGRYLLCIHLANRKRASYLDFNVGVLFWGICETAVLMFEKD